MIGTIHPEIPSPIDFDDPAQASAWVAATVVKRPWRPRFFAAFVDALNRHEPRPACVAELGSGPGHLAAALLAGCTIDQYLALDLSPAMHALAREHLAAAAASVTFVEADFRDPDWPARIGIVDAIVTIQAAHEVRHTSRLPALLERAHAAIRTGGVLLFCDHYAGPGSRMDAGLFVTRAEQPRLLINAGFGPVTLLHDEGGMALYAAERA